VLVLPLHRSILVCDGALYGRRGVPIGNVYHVPTGLSSRPPDEDLTPRCRVPHGPGTTSVAVPPPVLRSFGAFTTFSSTQDVESNPRFCRSPFLAARPRSFLFHSLINEELLSLSFFLRGPKLLFDSFGAGHGHIDNSGSPFLSKSWPHARFLSFLLSAARYDIAPTFPSPFSPLVGWAYFAFPLNTLHSRSPAPISLFVRGAQDSSLASVLGRPSSVVLTSVLLNQLISPSSHYSL